MINRHREELINAIIYFVQNTKFCGKLKLFKLLYFLDFEHYSQTGRSVTGLEYFAWKNGPVPIELEEEFDAPTADLAKNFSFDYVSTKNGQMLAIKTFSDFDSNHFSQRELKLLQQLAKKFKETKSEKMIEATHDKDTAWFRIFELEQGHNKLIPYSYAVQDEIVADLAKNNQEMLENYR